MKKFSYGFLLLLCAVCLALCVSASGAETVYLDGTVTASGDGLTAATAVKTLEEAEAAVADGGTIIVSGNTTTPTTAHALPAKDLTITAVNGAVLTLGRVLVANGDLTFENITIQNGTTTNVDFIYANGHHLTVGEGVNTVAHTTSKRHISLATGINTGTSAGGTVTVKSGTWRNIYGGNYQGTYSGNASIVFEGGSLSGGSMTLGNVSKGTNTAAVTVAISGGTVTTIQSGSVPAASYAVTLTGGTVNKLNVNATVAPAIDGSVTVADGTGTITTSAPNGYEVVVEGTTYRVEKKEAPKTVYLNATGEGGAYATLPEAAEAVADGGTIIVSGNTTTPTTAYKLPEKDITVTSQNDAVLTLGRVLIAGGDLTFKNITIANGTAANADFIYANGHHLTIGEGVNTVAHTTSKRHISLATGINDGTSAGGTVTVKSGTWRNIYGGNFLGTYSGNASIVFEGGSLSGGSMTLGNVSKGTNTAAVTVAISGGTVTTIQSGSVPAASYAVTLTGGTVNKLNVNATVSLAIGGSVTVADGTGTITTSAPDGYEVVATDGVYTVREKQVVDMTPKTVYLDGTGKTEGAYTSLSAALSDMPGGGTVILSGDTSITAATALPETAEVVITSVYGDEDYRETAALKFYANLALGGDTIFRDVAIERAKQTSANIFISAGGHKLVMDDGVICLNYTGLQWITLVGGNLSQAHEGDSHITVKSGHFRNIFGGNYNGSFTGNSYVTVTGGLYDNAVCGGSYSGDFTGDAHLTFGGEASMIAAGQGVIGGSLGVNGGTARTFTGDIYLTLTGSCAVNSNVFGSSRNDNITTVGDVLITVEEDAFAYHSLYGGGNGSVHDGNVKVVFNGGDIQGNIFGGAAAGTVTGNAEVIVNSGKLCYYYVDAYSSGSSPAGTRNVYGGGNAGSILGGNATVTINGGSIYGDVYGGGIDDTATVSGTSTLTVTGGTVFGKIGDADTSVIDLANSGSVSIGVNSAVDSLVGGGTLTLAAGASLTVNTISGETALKINGIPLPKAYITATDIAEDAKITYIAQNAENLVQNSSVYSIDFEGACPTVTVTVNHPSGSTCTLRAGGATYLGGFDNQDIAAETATSTTNTSSTYTLAPGLYTALVKRSEGNWRYKAIYVYGNAPTQTVTVNFDAPGSVGHEAKNGSQHTDELNAEHYDTSNIEGYFTPNTPYFNSRPGKAVFTTNYEANEFIRALDASTAHMYAFFPTKTKVNGFELPVVVFTKDEIPEGATIEEIAEIVGRQQGRDIIGITCAVHGNEPSAAEGALALISELCGEYGDTVFDGTNLGAIFMLPRVNPEGLYNYSRMTTADVLNANINRDYAMASDVGSATYAYVYQLFMPTMTIDLHEAMNEPVWSEGDLLTDIYDASISYFATVGSSLANSKAILYGDLAAARDNIGEQLCYDALENLQAIGIRSYYYRKDFAPVFGQTYSANMGAFAYVLEIPGILGAEQHYARRTFSQMRSMQELINLAIATDGEMAEAAIAARENLTESAQIYDGRRAVTLDQCDSRVEKYGYKWNNPLIGADGTVRYAENITTLGSNDTAMRYRSLPTAYVFPADATDVASTLALFDRQGIKYYLLDAGTTLTLQQYSGTNESATLSDAKEVAFENGAYIVPLDDYRAYVTAYLFEPDNTDAATDIIATIADAGYLAVDEIYRSTENFIAAKLGLDGTYLAVDVPAGKTVASATVDGTDYNSVNTEGAQAFVLASDKDAYAVTLTFTDGTSETTYVGDVPGDMNGDRTVDVLDVLLALGALLNDEAPATGDVTGDGRFSLADVIRILKTSAQ